MINLDIPVPGDGGVRLVVVKSCFGLEAICIDRPSGISLLVVDLEEAEAGKDPISLPPLAVDESYCRKIFRFHASGEFRGIDREARRAMDPQVFDDLCDRLVEMVRKPKKGGRARGCMMEVRHVGSQ